MTNRAKTYKAMLVGITILAVAGLVYFGYLGLKNIFHFSPSAPTSSQPAAAPLNPVGEQQQIKENSPTSDVPASGSSQYNVVPVGSQTGTNSSTPPANKCPDYLGDQKDCVQSNYTFYGPK